LHNNDFLTAIEALQEMEKNNIFFIENIHIENNNNNNNDDKNINNNKKKILIKQNYTYKKIVTEGDNKIKKTVTIIKKQHLNLIESLKQLLVEKLCASGDIFEIDSVYYNLINISNAG
jgi:hypothetical protein